MASYFMNAKKHVSLMFHKWAMINDTTGLLQGDREEGRTAKFASMDEIESRKVVQEWVRMLDEK